MINLILRSTTTTTSTPTTSSVTIHHRTPISIGGLVVVVVVVVEVGWPRTTTTIATTGIRQRVHFSVLCRINKVTFGLFNRNKVQLQSLSLSGCTTVVTASQLYCFHQLLCYMFATGKLQKFGSLLLMDVLSSVFVR